MAINYTCDNCEITIQEHLSSVIISGGQNLRVLCEDCWNKIEVKVLKEKEMSNANQI